MKGNRWNNILGLLAGLLTVWSGVSLGAGGASVEAPQLDPALKINQLQVLGTHNSYSAGMDPKVLELVADKLDSLIGNYVNKMPTDASALFREEHPNSVGAREMLRYEHPDLRKQLDVGVRSLEIDINPDPDGTNYRDPVGYRILRDHGITDLRPYDSRDLDKPGFKVLHIPDIDFRSNCPTLVLCLTQIRDWSDAHPRHVPLFILIEAKVQDIPLLPGATHTIPFSAKLFDDMDSEIKSVMGRKRVITPDDVRGNFPTLRSAVLAGNWPTLKQSRGKVLFLLMTATGPSGATGYLEGHPSLKGRMAFLRSSPSDNYAAFLLYDNAIARQSEIREYVKSGYLVRTRSDIETFEAKVNDMTRANVAFESGAQIVSTDFEMSGNSYSTSYVVALPGSSVARKSPVFLDK